MPTRIRPPQQARSQETLDRLLDAADAVLAEKSFSEATLAEIVERAGLTVGAFYRRFPDKDALLHHFDDIFFAELEATVETLLAPERWAGASAADIIITMTAEATALYRTRRGLLRSLFLRARGDKVIQESARRVNARFIAALETLLLPRRAELSHPDLPRAIGVGFTMLVGALRETIVFGEVWPGGGPGDDPRLERDLARLYLCFLGGEMPVTAVPRKRKKG